MKDREAFEDPASIDWYLRTLPHSTVNYRARLRDELTRQSGHRTARSKHFVLVIASILIAACVAVAALVLPLRPQAATANAYVILRRVAASESGSIASSGSALITFTVARDRIPLRIARDLGPWVITTDWRVIDQTHFRIDSHLLSPAIESGDQTVVANGRRVTVYNDVNRLAVRGTIDPRLSSFILGGLQSGVGLPSVPSAPALVRELEQTRGDTHASFLGRRQYLGRTVDVVEFHPVVFALLTRCPAPHRCQTYQRGFGRAVLWVDHAHPVLLKYTQSGIPAAVDQADLTYRVTAISFHPPSRRTSLDYRPPTRPADAGSSWVRSLFGAVGLASGVGHPQQWRQVPGFIVAPPPLGPRHLPFTLISTVEQRGSFPLRTTGLDGLYVQNRPPPSAYGATQLGPNLPIIRGPYLYIRERLRVNGMPSALRTGTRHLFGGCRIWTGAYPGTGDTRLTLERGHISLLAVGYLLSQKRLLQYAERRLCS